MNYQYPSVKLVSCLNLVVHIQWRSLH